jgi:hypothetical protein
MKFSRKVFLRCSQSMYTSLRLACLATLPVSRLSIEYFHASSPCIRYGSWGPVASVVSQPAMASQIDQLHGCVARVGSILEQVEPSLDRLSLLSAMFKTTPTSGPPSEVGGISMEGMRAELYGNFSPRVGTLRHCCKSCPLFCLLKVRPPSRVWLWCCRSCPSLNLHEQSEVDFAPIPPPLAHNPDALFAKELCDLLDLGVRYCSMWKGGCLCPKCKIKKVGDCPRTSIWKEKSLRSKGKKSDTIGKAHAASRWMIFGIL